MQYSKKQHLMGTIIDISIITDNNPLEDIYNCFGIFYSLEKEFSRFLKESDLSLLNIKKKFEVSNRFIEVFNLSKEVYDDTSTYFNPLVNLSNIGYSEDFSKGIFEKSLEKENLDINKISTNGNTLKLEQNQNLDLGGIVKGYCVDLTVEYLKNKGYKDFIINAGGDIYLSGNNTDGNTPLIAIDNPFIKKEIFATIELKDKSISTSGTYKRKWNVEEDSFHHILDPETSSNNNEIISITLISDKCYIADAYATACIAMGIEKSLIFLQKQNIDGIIIGNDSNVYQTKGMRNYNLKIL